MSPYRFRLEAVRRIREVRRDEVRGQLADAFRAADKIAEQSKAVEKELSEVRDAMAQISQASHMDVNRLLDAQRYELILKGQLQQLAEKAKLVEQEVDRRRGLVVAAEREVKVLDTLDRNGQQRYEAEAARAENKQMDEIAGVLWNRR